VAKASGTAPKPIPLSILRSPPPLKLWRTGRLLRRRGDLRATPRVKKMGKGRRTIEFVSNAVRGTPEAKDFWSGAYEKGSALVLALAP